ncbi:uncharacterized protein LOC132732413 [Ruditapes philippinarum]|uniref:uncharacterized protein LOC132732413 n=1 Tax=Ruditapes philippinarum TaxID=129788 RepID=UPI00295B431A|nr:uncharacterized protein LOC132732413 [Ruditapes philippinarum]
MACVFRLRLFPGKIGYRFTYFHNTYVCNQYTSARELCLSACHGKTRSENSVSKTDYPSDNDLDNDFFGLNALDRKDPKPHKSITKEEKIEEMYVKKMLHQSNAANDDINIKMRSYGSIRYDNAIPISEKPPKLTRKQKRLKSGTMTGESDTYKISSALHNENKGNKMYNDKFSVNKENFNDVKKFTNTEIAQNMCKSKEDLSFVDEQYFASDYVPKINSSEYDRKTLSKTENFIDVSKCTKSENAENLYENASDLSFVDRQFFLIDHDYKKKAERNTVDGIENSCESDNLTMNESAENLLTNEEELNFFDEQYFDNKHVSKDVVPREYKLQKSFDQVSGHRNVKKNQPKSVETFDLAKFEKTLKETADSVEPYSKPVKSIEEPKKKSDINNSQNLMNENQSSEENQSVYAASIKIRKELEKKRGSNLTGTYDPKEYDSKGFRILTNQVPHFDNAPSIDVVKVLRRSIIYDDNDIVAISKPYGLPSVDGPNVLHSVGNLLDEIIPNTKLFRVHRLDKETTGVMLLAKTEEMAKRLSERFYNRDLVKKYVVITKNIPEMQCGEIDIPIIEGTVEGKIRMCLRPHDCPTVRAIDKKRQAGIEAITKYRVLDQGDKCALIECLPLTGKKHQIRVHLAFGLNCPILGDHKYSHIDRIAPMKLHPEILKRLGIQQSKVRCLAMHLHARSVMIPEFLDGKNLFIKAPVPPHFVRNMKDLKLKFPKERYM